MSDKDIFKRLVDKGCALGLEKWVVEDVARYVIGHAPLGGYLEAVICNDLKGAFSRADETSMAEMPGLVKFLWNYVPSSCWGSKENYEMWLREES